MNRRAASKAIGTTGRGIGPAYEDKVSRRGLRLGELLDAAHFTERLREVMEYHNHALEHYFKTRPGRLPAGARRGTGPGRTDLRPMVADIPGLLHRLRREGSNIMFEGAQGALLDIDHGTYPYVTSSTTTAGGAASGSGVGPRHLDYVLGIVKAYTTRVGAGSVSDRTVRRGWRLSRREGTRIRCHHRPQAPLWLAGYRGAAAFAGDQQRDRHVHHQAGCAGRYWRR